MNEEIFAEAFRNEFAKIAEECATPGEKIRSKGKGRGLAIGKGKGPIGIPVGDKTDTGPPGKGKNDPRFLENIGRGFKKKAASVKGGSKVSDLLASLKKEPKRKA